MIFVLKFFRSLYLGKYLSKSIHTWVIVTQYGKLGPLGLYGGVGGVRGQNLVHLQKVVFLCWSFLEVYIFATTYQKAFILEP